MTEIKYSISPAGETFALPTKDEYGVELKRIEKLVEEARKKNQEIVVANGHHPVPIGRSHWLIKESLL